MGPSGGSEPAPLEPVPSVLENWSALAHHSLLGPEPVGVRLIEPSGPISANDLWSTGLAWRLEIPEGIADAYVWRRELIDGLEAERGWESLGISATESTDGFWTFDTAQSVTDLKLGWWIESHDLPTEADFSSDTGGPPNARSVVRRIQAQALVPAMT